MPKLRVMTTKLYSYSCFNPWDGFAEGYVQEVDPDEGGINI